MVVELGWFASAECHGRQASVFLNLRTQSPRHFPLGSWKKKEPLFLFGQYENLSITAAVSLTI